MIHGLRITMSGEELIRRISDRLALHESALRELDGRLERRRGDLLFHSDADGLQPLSERQAEHACCSDRVSSLTLLRDKIVAMETYDLGIAELRLLDLLPPGPQHPADAVESNVDVASRAGVIDGFKLTLTGTEIRELIAERIECHRASIQHWNRELARTPEEQTDEAPLLPAHMCENEAERHEWRIEVLEFMSDHIDTAATYRLADRDLEFGELLPEKPGWVAQDEYEERTGIRFNLERLAKAVERGGVRIAWSTAEG
jgi:hypothetical protein